jgi:phosphoglycolate phosphatase
MGSDTADAPDAKQPLALLFDWDNTLVDNWLSIVDAMNFTLAAMGHRQWNAAEARLRIRRSMRETFPLLFGENWTEAQRIFYERFEAAHLNEPQWPSSDVRFAHSP